MQIHNLKPKHPLKSKKRIGRGGKRGTYSGKGVKGQKSRAGAKIRPEWRDVVKSIPKKKGYRQKPMIKKLGQDLIVVNLDQINKNYQSGEVVSVNSLTKKEIIKVKKSIRPIVKILGRGEIGKKITIKDCSISDSAKNKIEKAGGKIYVN